MRGYNQVDVDVMVSFYGFKQSTIEQAFDQPFSCPKADESMGRLFANLSRNQAIQRFVEADIVVDSPAHWAAVRRIAQFFPVQTNTPAAS